jgi:hypothetical protein
MVQCAVLIAPYELTGIFVGMGWVRAVLTATGYSVATLILPGIGVSMIT